MYLLVKLAGNLLVTRRIADTNGGHLPTAKYLVSS